MIFAYGTISDDFLDTALQVFVGFWSIMIVIGVAFFGYVYFTVRRRDRMKPK